MKELAEASAKQEKFITVVKIPDGFVNFLGLFSICFRKFLTPSDIPDEVQYFAWAPEGNKLVSLDRKVTGYTYIALSHCSGLKGTIGEVIEHNLSQTLLQASKFLPEGSDNRPGRRFFTCVFVFLGLCLEK